MTVIKIQMIPDLEFTDALYQKHSKVKITWKEHLPLFVNLKKDNLSLPIVWNSKAYIKLFSLVFQFL